MKSPEQQSKAVAVLIFAGKVFLAIVAHASKLTGLILLKFGELIEKLIEHE